MGQVGNGATCAAFRQKRPSRRNVKVNLDRFFTVFAYYGGPRRYRSKPETRNLQQGCNHDGDQGGRQAIFQYCRARFTITGFAEISPHKFLLFNSDLPHRKRQRSAEAEMHAAGNRKN